MTDSIILLIIYDDIYLIFNVVGTKLGIYLENNHDEVPRLIKSIDYREDQSFNDLLWLKPGDFIRQRDILPGKG